MYIKVVLNRIKAAATNLSRTKAKIVHNYIKFASTTTNNIKASASYNRIVASVVKGEFIVFRLISDTLSAAESLVKALGIGKSDSVSATEVLQFDVSKVATDSSNASDTALVGFGKVVSDSGATSDSNIIDFSKYVSDSANTTDQIQTFAIGKFITDSAYATDDFDGVAVPDDDQTIQFVKSLGNIGYASDNDVKSIGKISSDSVSSSDNGTLINQGYVDNLNYFADDYVGAKRTF